MSSLTLDQILEIGTWVLGAAATVSGLYALMLRLGNKVLGAALEKHLRPITEHQAALGKDVRALRNELTQNNLQTARVDLNQAIEHTPHEHKAILDLAWHYFVELGGDTYMTGVFKDWAEKEQVDIEYILQHIRHAE